MKTKIIIEATIQHPDDLLPEDVMFNTLESLQRNLNADSDGAVSAEDATVRLAAEEKADAPDVDAKETQRLQSK